MPQTDLNRYGYWTELRETYHFPGGAYSLLKMDDVDHIEVYIMDRVPETMHQAVIRGFDKEGRPVHAFIETINILRETEEYLLHDCPDVVDNRSPIGNH